MARDSVFGRRYRLSTGGYSMEGDFLVLGRVLSRDGAVHFHGGMVGRRCSEIHRIPRPSLGAETHAAITSADWALRVQIFLTEIFTQESEIKKIPIRRDPRCAIRLRNHMSIRS